MIYSNSDLFYSSARLIHSPGRKVAWVDYAKGLCIFMVVMMHATLEYGAAVGSEGWLHYVVAFADPFLMAGFFLLVGLFLSLSIKGPLREFMDRKVLQFVYLYMMWLLIHLGVAESGVLFSDPARFISLYLFAWVEPVSTLWFVHMLAIFYLVTRLVRNVPAFFVFLAAAGLQIAFQSGWIGTGWIAIDRFFEHYVYFFTGYAIAPWIFSFARQLPVWRYLALAWLILWAVVNYSSVGSGIDELPGLGLILGFIGAVAVVTAGSLLADQRWARGLRYCGENFIAIYLGFFLPMLLMIKVLANSGVIADVGLASLLLTSVAVVLPLAFYWFVNDTWLAFLFERPAAFRLGAGEAHAARL